MSPLSPFFAQVQVRIFLKTVPPTVIGISISPLSFGKGFPLTTEIAIAISVLATAIPCVFAISPIVKSVTGFAPFIIVIPEVYACSESGSLFSSVAKEIFSFSKKIVYASSPFLPSAPCILVQAYCVGSLDSEELSLL